MICRCGAPAVTGLLCLECWRTAHPDAGPVDHVTELLGVHHHEAVHRPQGEWFVSCLADREVVVLSLGELRDVLEAAVPDDVDAAFELVVEKIKEMA